MTNDQILNIICDMYNINLEKYYPSNEYNFLFDKNYEIDRIYLTEFNSFKKRIRFVKYDKNNITIFIIKMKVSDIIFNNVGEKTCYFKEKMYNVDLKTVERIFKINKIKNLNKK